MKRLVRKGKKWKEKLQDPNSPKCELDSHLRYKFRLRLCYSIVLDTWFGYKQRFQVRSVCFSDDFRFRVFVASLVLRG